MKRLLYIALILFVTIACNKAKEGAATLVLSLKNADMEQVEASIIKDFIAYNREIIQATADENGLYSFSLDISEPKMVQVNLGQKRLQIFLDQGANLRVEVDMSDWDNTLTFKGDYAAENTFLTQNTRAKELQFGQMLMMKKYREATAGEFADFANEMHAASAEALNSYNKKQKLDQDFKNWFTTDNDYTRYTNLLNYSPYFTYFNKTEPEVSEEYYDFIPEAMVFTDEHFRVGSFTGFLNTYMQHYLRSQETEMPAQEEVFEKSIMATNTIYEGKARDFVMTNLINAELNWGDFKKAEARFEEFRQSSPHTEFIALLQQAYDNALRVAPGNAAPAFTLTDLEGKEVSLQDFSGKVIYLDFWASWCAPCMREVPYAKELKKRFEGEEELVFLYISVDEDQDAWRKTVEQQQIEGVHLNVKGMQADIAKQYNVKGVPTFYIIDKQGVIHNNNPGRPSSGDVIDEQLRTALGA